MAFQTFPGFGIRNISGSFTSSALPIPGNQTTGKITFMSNTRQSDLEDPNKWFEIEIQKLRDADGDGTPEWVEDAKVLYKGGPQTLRDGTVVPFLERGLSTDAGQYAGHDLRGIIRVWDGDPRAGGTPSTARIGMEYEIV